MAIINKTRNKCLRGCGEVLLRRKIGAASMEDSMVVLQKFKNRATI